MAFTGLLCYKYLCSMLEIATMSESFNRSFAQFGEDLLVTQLLGTEPGRYVDVGAHDPWRYSNTALLYGRGWRGINIDADARAIQRFQADRPEDINLHVGIAAESGVAEFAVFGDGAVNSFDPSLAAKQNQAFGPPVMHAIRTEPLAAVLTEHLTPGLRLRYLNVDCEGLDDIVLRSNDWDRFRPDVITVELHGLNLEAVAQNPSYQFLRSVGYVMRAHYFATSIFHHLSAMR